MISARGTDLCASGRIQLTSLLSEYSWSRSLKNVMYNKWGYTKRASCLAQTEIWVEGNRALRVVYFSLFHL